MTNSTYNGWTNRATWLVNLWVGDSLAELAQEGSNVDAQYAMHYVLDLLETSGSTVEDAFASDLISYALGDVNWTEIADAAKGE